MKLPLKSILLSALFVSSSLLSVSASAATIELAPQSFNFVHGLVAFNSGAFSIGKTTYFHETITFGGLTAGTYDIDASISGVNLGFTPNGANGGVWLDGHAYLLSYGSTGVQIKSGNIQYTGSAPLKLDIYGVSTAAVNSFFNGSISATLVPAPVPEPESYAMMAGGLALLGTLSRRRAKRRAAAGSTA